MKPGLFFLFFLLAACKQQPSGEGQVKIAGIHQDQSNHEANGDSLLLEEQNQTGEWMVKTFYELRQLGYNSKRAWTYIDSATKANYRDSLPHWYPELKQRTDSLMRDKKKYKRVPII